MKRIVIVFFLFVSFYSIAQNYEWRPIIPGLACMDSSYNTCNIGLFVPDTVHHTLWMLGRFDGGGGIASPIAVGFDGNNWLPFPGVYGSNRYSNTFCAIMYNGKLIIGKTDGVEQFDFSNGNWNSIGTASAPILCLGIYNGDLIAGGGFWEIDGVLANSIARWDGTQWYALGDGIDGSSHIIKDLEIYNGKLYAGGAFDYADSIDAWNIAEWNGSNWNNLCSSGGSYGTDRLDGNHFAAEILDMEVFNNNLYITGQFEKVCNIDCYLAYWDDTTWHGTSYPYFQGKSISANEDTLIVESYGGTTFPNHHFYWNGIQAMAVDSGFEAGGSNDLEVFQNIFYSGGGFDHSGNTPIFRIARLMDIGNGVNEIGNAIGIKIYPNPASEQLIIDNGQLTMSEIEIADVLGRELITIKPADTITTIDIAALSKGVYLLRVESKNGNIQIAKFIKE